jgi:hypothetical protein
VASAFNASRRGACLSKRKLLIRIAYEVVVATVREVVENVDLVVPRLDSLPNRIERIASRTARLIGWGSTNNASARSMTKPYD